MPKLLQVFLKFSLSPLMYGTTISIFFPGTSFVGVVLTDVDCMYIVCVVPVVKFCLYSVEGPVGGTCILKMLL